MANTFVSTLSLYLGMNYFAVHQFAKQSIYGLYDIVPITYYTHGTT